LAAVKICGITKGEDAFLSEEAGASYIGMIASRGYTRSVEIEFIERVASSLSRARPVAVVADRDALMRVIGAGIDVVIQLHMEDPGEGDLEAATSNGYRVILVAIASGISREDIDKVIPLAARYASYIEYFLVDSPKRRPSSGTYSRGSSLPVDLYSYGCSRYRPCGAAGRITPENAPLLKHVSPDVIDASSGVEAYPGKKDPARVRALVEVARDL